MHRIWRQSFPLCCSLNSVVLVLATLVVWSSAGLVGVSADAGLQGRGTAYGPVSAPDTSVRPARVGAPVPDFEVEHLRDSTRTFEPSDFEGKYVLLNLWATWCAPCVDKIPALQKARERYSTDTLAFLNVSFDRSRSAAIDLLEKRELPGAHAFVGISSLGGDFGAKFAQIPGEGRSIRGLPNLTLVGPKGEVVEILRPAAETGLLTMLKSHLP